jgi:hypothetical protein
VREIPSIFSNPTGADGTPFAPREVGRDDEFRRIEALPRRLAPVVDAGMLTRYLRTPTGTQSLRENQAASLSDLYDFGGLFGMQGTGAGKTLISLLAPMLPHPQNPQAPWVQRPVLLVPASLKYKTEDVDIPFYRQHWRLHPHLRIVSNQLLQTLPNKDLLRRYMPDLIVLDEAHEYRNRTAARTKRLLAYLKENPDTKLVVLSGTLTKRSIKDYWHLLRYALPRHCPLPLHWPTLQEWSEALDEDVPDARRRLPGALVRFCAQNENPRQGFRRRLTETPGVVATKESSCDASLNVFEKHPVRVDPLVVQAFARMRDTNTTPSGDELTDRFNVWRRTKELAYGFFYRWIWPNNTPDAEWLAKRKTWRKFVRETLENNRRGLDSERAVAQACEQGLYDPTALTEWQGVKKRYYPHPPREAVWVSDYLLREAATWMQENVGLVWVEHDAVGKRLATISGAPYFGAGDDGIARYDRTCVVSVHAHGKGQNLQRFTKNLHLCCPSGGDIWEQVVARTHRFGQTADEVSVEVYLHCLELWEAFEKARSDARYIEDSTGQAQKLNIATMSVSNANAVANRILSGDPLWKK